MLASGRVAQKAIPTVNFLEIQQSPTCIYKNMSQIVVTHFLARFLPSTVMILNCPNPQALLKMMSKATPRNKKVELYFQRPKRQVSWKKAPAYITNVSSFWYHQSWPNLDREFHPDEPTGVSLRGAVASDHLWVASNFSAYRGGSVPDIADLIGHAPLATYERNPFKGRLVRFKPQLVRFKGCVPIVFWNNLRRMGWLTFFLGWTSF